MAAPIPLPRKNPSLHRVQHSHDHHGGDDDDDDHDDASTADVHILAFDKRSLEEKKTYILWFVHWQMDNNDNDDSSGWSLFFCGNVKK